MAAKTITSLRYGVECELQVATFNVATVSDGDTVTVPGFAGFRSMQLTPSTATAVGATNVGNVITILIGTGTPNLVCRVSGLI